MLDHNSEGFASVLTLNCSEPPSSIDQSDSLLWQADLYLSEGEELSFYEVLLRARQRREIVIGYRAANAERAVINPPAKTERRRWSLKDAFVVIAEKE
ncbi:hypothetical protein OIU78_023050 [Salix suchowensis]|nr:hypothetical protein OIU78_023050 [Salix suchowensis]